jgi:hypothetical protein
MESIPRNSRRKSYQFATLSRKSVVVPRILPLDWTPDSGWQQRSQELFSIIHPTIHETFHFKGLSPGHA